MTLNNPSTLEVKLQPWDTDLDVFLYSNCGYNLNCVGYSVNNYTNADVISLPNAYGTYYIVVDGYNSYQNGPFDLTVNCPSPNTKPNLTCHYTGNLSYDGTTVSISGLQIKNTGNAKADFSYVGYYLSTNTTITTEDIRIGADYVGSLNPGAISLESINIDLSSFSLQPGTYYVGILADYQNFIDESNEDDNSCYWTYPTITVHSGQPNLACEGTPLLNVNGTSVAVNNLGVINNGNAASGSSHVGYYLSLDTDITTSDYFIGSKAIGALSPGQTTYVSFSTDVGGLGIPSGTYYIGIIVDYQNEVVEGKEHDNSCFWYNPKVTIHYGQPNLKCAGNVSVTVNGTYVSVNNLGVTNTGNAASGSSHVGYYLSLDTDITTSDHFIGSKAVPALSSGHTTYVNFSTDVASLGLPSGTYYVGIIVDYQNEVAESNEHDNSCFWYSPRVTIQAGQPNLKCAGNVSVTVNGTYVSVNNLGVANVGNAASGSSHVGYYLSLDTDITTSDHFIGSKAVGALSPGQTSYVSFSVDVASLGLPSGTYYVGIIVDYQNEVAESNEHDNSCFWYSPRVTIQAGQPNLKCAGNVSVTVNGTYVSVNNLGVANVGNAASGSSHVGYYLSLDTDITTSDHFIGSKAVGALSPGQTSYVSFSVDVASLGLPSGTYYVGIIVDYQNEVAESNEHDNSCFWYSPRVTIQSGQPNLKCAGSVSLTVNGTYVSVNNLGVANVGNAASGSSHVGYYLSLDTDITTSDHFIGSKAIGALSPGQTSYVSFSVDVASLGLPSGTYYVGIIVDYQNEVAESNEHDNSCFWYSPRVTIQSGQPNLKCAGSVSLTVNGTYVSVNNLGVANVGNAASGSSHVGYYLSLDTDITTSDHFIGSKAVGALSPGQTAYVNFSTDVASLGLPSGTYYVGIIVDYQNEVAESNEHDNSCFWYSPRVTIQAGQPNLKCAGNVSVTVNGTYVSVNNLGITNIGDGSAGGSQVGYYLSLDTDITTSDYFIGSNVVGALWPGQTIYKDFSVDVASLGLPSGTYYVGIIVDYQNEVAESNEHDNSCFWYSPRITIQSGQPNLKCAGNVSVTVNGTYISVNNLGVVNTGSVAAGSSHVGYFLSLDTDITTNDYFIGSQSIGTLSPGQTMYVNFSANAAGLGIPPGTYFVGIITDYQNAVNESNEHDNSCYWQTPKVTIECVCTAVYQPVCGSDGITYSNACFAECAGVSYTYGACADPITCQCTNHYADYFCDNFEEYHLGKLGPQSTCWTTWSGNEGGNEDGEVREAGGNQYLRMQGTSYNGGAQDVVLQLGDRTSGKYTLEFKIFVYYGERGYYNILHRFTAGSSNNQWAQEVFFDGQGTGRLRAGGQYFPFNYTTDQWIIVKQEFDIDNNNTSLYIGGHLVKQWPFSYQNSTIYNGEKRLAAVDFYPPSTAYRFFIDDIEFDKVDTFSDEVAGRFEDSKPEPQNEEEDIAENTINPTSTDVDEVTLADFTIYPNPATDVLNIELSLSEVQDVDFALIDATGQIVVQQQLNGDYIKEDFQINDLPNGLYFARIIYGKEQQIKKVSVVK